MLNVDYVTSVIALEMDSQILDEYQAWSGGLASTKNTNLLLYTYGTYITYK